MGHTDYCYGFGELDLSSKRQKTSKKKPVKLLKSHFLLGLLQLICCPMVWFGLSCQKNRMK